MDFQARTPSRSVGKPMRTQFLRVLAAAMLCASCLPADVAEPFALDGGGEGEIASQSAAPVSAQHAACSPADGTPGGGGDARGRVSGSDPPSQRDAEPSLLDSPLASVLRGRVYDEEGNPPAGVRIDVLGSESFGHTWTRT